MRRATNYLIVAIVAIAAGSFWKFLQTETSRKISPQDKSPATVRQSQDAHSDDEMIGEESSLNDSVPSATAEPADEHAELESMEERLMSGEVSQFTSEELFNYLKTVEMPDADLRRQRRRYLKNEVMNALGEDSAIASKFGETLVAVHQDKEQDLAVRDYALQHLRYVAASAQEVATVGKYRQVFVEALESEDIGIAGTSLIAMHRLAGNQKLFAGEEVLLAAENILREESPVASPAAYLTALQVATERNSDIAISVSARILREAGKHSNDLILAAINAAATVRPEKASEIALSEIAENPDLPAYVVRAAQGAIASIVNSVE